MFDLIYREHPFSIILGYMAIYILVISISLPGAAVMTIVAGTLFGFWKGTLIVSFASTIGSTLACFVSRFILRDWVKTKFEKMFSIINRGIEQEGAFYLFTLRLVPIFPLWLINLVAGLTDIPISTFYWVSQAGMLPGTMVYVNAGKELADIDSVSGIFTPGLLFSFALLGIFPVVVKKAISIYRKKRRRSIVN
jgi:uncharacterized membrane protein YdjX (TVP38/TMEM64 family)